MDALVVLLGCLTLGALLGKLGRVPAGMVPALTFWVVNVALPATTLAVVPSLVVDGSVWFLVLPQWAGLGVAAAVVIPIGRWRRWPAPRIGALVLLAGLANTSFVGFPLIEATRGHAALAPAAIADQAGAFLALALVGMAIAAHFAGGSVGPRDVVRKVATFPPTWALLVGLLVGALGGWPPPVMTALERVGHTLSPLALFAVGLRLRLRPPPGALGPMLLALLLRLAVVPALALLLAHVAGVDGQVRVVGVLQAAMPPMITVAILCEREGLEPELAHATLTLGILAAMLSVPAWSALL